MTVRKWNRATDTVMLAEWFRAHSERPFPLELLPPTGIIAEDETGPLAACFLYLSYGIGVAFVEAAVSRPGLSLKRSRQAFAAVLGGLEVIARAHDTGVLVCHALPALARVLESGGWQFSETHVLTGTKIIR